MDTEHVPDTVKQVLKDHCHERPLVLTDHTFLAEGPPFQYNLTYHNRPPVLTDHIFVANGAVFQDRFYCIAFHGVKYVRTLYDYLLKKPPNTVN